MRLSTTSSLSLRSLLVLAATSFGAVACTAEDEAELATSDADLSSGIVEGTPEAAAVVRVANEKSAAALHAEVGLTAAAAKAIAGWRLGPDKVAGSSDDRTFQTLAQLDALPGVGVKTLKAMLAWAKSQGWLGGPLQCTGADLQSSDLDAVGASEFNAPMIGGYRIEQRTRTCAGTNCTAWQDDGKVGTGVVYAQSSSDGTRSLMFMALGRLAPDQKYAAIGLGASFDASRFAALVGDGFTFTGSLKGTCGEVHATRSEPVDAQHTKETELTLRAFYSVTGGSNASLTTPTKLEFSCQKTVVGYEYTCQGQTTEQQTLSGYATVNVSADGASLTLTDGRYIVEGIGIEDGTYPFDASGRLTKDFSGAPTTLYAVRTPGGLVVETLYAWYPSGNWCGAAPHTSIDCIGILPTP